MRSMSLAIALTITLCCAYVTIADADILPQAKSLAEFLPVGMTVKLTPTASEKYDIRIGGSEALTSSNSTAARQKTQWAIKEAKSNTDPNQQARMQRLINELEAESVATTAYKVVISSRDFIAFEAIGSDSQSWIVLPITSIHSIRK